MNVCPRNTNTMKVFRQHTKRLLGATAISLVLANAAFANEKSINIAEQKTEAALLALAEQTSVQIMFETGAVAQLSSPAISGTMNIEAALTKLLKGTDLIFKKVSDRVYIVQKVVQEQPVQPPVNSATETPTSAAAAEQSALDQALEEIVVVGSQVKGAQITDTLPVTVMSVRDIEASGATSFEELIGELPQAGAMDFNSGSELSNDARGDIASLNLRALGADTSLILVNGRRMVSHAQTQTFNGVPIQFTNMNAIPTAGLGRLEVLRDGAAALYGSDAVAGVMNAVIRRDYEGLTADMRLSDTEDSRMHDYRARLYGGTDFNEGATNVVFSLAYYNRTGLDANERENSAQADKRFLLDEDSPFFNNTSLRNNSSFGLFGEFRAGLPDSSTDRMDGEQVSDADGNSLTTSSGQFHLQPSGVFPNDSQFGIGFGGHGLEIDDGSSTSTSQTSGNGIALDNGIVVNPLRYNMNEFRRMIPDTKRFNAMAAIEHDFDNGVTFFGDMIYYHSSSYKFFGPPLLSTSNNFTIPANYYWNPFGPTTLENGDANPNRVAAIDAPDEGYDIQVRRARFLDLGPRDIDVSMDQFRVLAGLSGDFSGWDWESAVGYSESKATDTSLLISRSLLFDELSRTDADAFNVFAGHQIDQSDKADRFGVDVTRKSKNTLATTDFKVSKADLFALPAGDVGMAAGIEWRRETINDDRDDRLDGTITFTNPITGEVFDSDIAGVSGTSDVSASRNVYSAYVEALVPLLEDKPLFHSLNLQLAARYEKYTDINADVLKPRVALSWYVTDWVQLRGAWSKGFRAPNLVQVNQPEFSRFTNFQEDWSRCTDIDDCSDRAVISRITGNPDLKPESSTNYSLGLVVQPPALDGLTLAVDYWSVKQSGTVGTIERNDQIALDEYLRRTQGSSNPDVVRADVTEDDIAAFAGSGITPYGEILFVRQTFLNLQDREVAGIDFTATYRGIETPLGFFTLKMNAAYLEKFEQQAFDLFAPLLEDEIAAGNLDSSASGDLRRIERRPKWRYNFSILWDKGNWGAGLTGRYVGSVIDPDVTATLDSGEEIAFPIDSWFTMNAYADYTFGAGALDRTRVRFGVKNLTDKAPPLFDNSAGYSAGLHSIRGREFYLSLRTHF